MLDRKEGIILFSFDYFVTLRENGQYIRNGILINY